VKSLDQNLARIRDDVCTPKDFIIADAKNGDIGGGCTTPGSRRDGIGEKTKPDRDLKAASAIADPVPEA